MNVLIDDLQAGAELSNHQIESAAELLLDGKAQDQLKLELLEALANKGETPAEIAGFVEAFLEHAVDPHLGLLELDGPTLDVCGTGGDKLDLFNVSTTSMFVAAAGGAVVVKHGNRGITSKSGGADVLESLGVKIDLDAEGFRRCIEQAGVGFMFAPMYHPAFKAVVPVRKALAEKGIRTIFNLMGPLLNPVRPQCQLVGVFGREFCPTFADILQRLGRESAWAVHGSTADGGVVDEVSLMGPTRICKSGTLQEMVDEEIHPGDFDLELAKVEDLKGGDAKRNAAILKDILSGKEQGPKRDMVLMNAGASLACAGLADDMGQGIKLAAECIDNGSAMEKLHLMREASQS
ncbi:MAG: anthranilate phosphoribosyltransferase [Akkermansiaceae bacterium]|nr:anthranilate phosphoribosyltransferase [Akkermansiaceae bacterium]